MKEPGKVAEIHQAWLLMDKSKVRYGCVFGLIDNVPELDIMTSPVVEYEIPSDRSYVIVVTRSGSTYRIVNPDSAFIKDLLTYMDDK